MGQRRSAQEWAELVEQWQRSGLTAKEFAGQAGLNPKTLSWWKWYLSGDGPHNKRRASRPAKGSGLVSVEVVPARSVEAETPIEVVVDATVIRVRRGFDQDTLAQVLEVLEGEDE